MIGGRSVAPATEVMAALPMTVKNSEILTPPMLRRRA
jgi:hypothetical protein